MFKFTMIALALLSTPAFGNRSIEIEPGQSVTIDDTEVSCRSSNSGSDLVWECKYGFHSEWHEDKDLAKSYARISCRRNTINSDSNCNFRGCELTTRSSVRH